MVESNSIDLVRIFFNVTDLVPFEEFDATSIAFEAEVAVEGKNSYTPKIEEIGLVKTFDPIID